MNYYDKLFQYMREEQGLILLESEMQEIVRIVREMIAAEWIDVNDRLPEHENNVLAVLNGQVCIMNYFDFTEDGQTHKVWGYVYDGINGDGIYDDNYTPSHWMEISTYSN
jgi:hypothetical protein